MQKNKLTYLKNIREALNTYNEENDVLDLEYIQKIYGYANNLEHLSLDEYKDLDEFIAENTISIEHLANIFLDKKGEENLNFKLIRMIPIQVTKPQSKIRVIKGKENELIGAMQQDNMVKVLCTTRKKYQKAA